MKPVSTGKLNYIQALRAIAVIMVALQHYRGGLQFSKHGYAGIDLFFVISGFIMVLTTQNMANPARAAATFFVKRIARIWPPYFVLTLIYFVLLSPERHTFSLHASISWIIRSISFWPSWLQQPIIGVGWSLTFEVLFYLLFGLAIFAGRLRWVSLCILFASTMVLLPLAAGKGFSLLIGPPFSVEGVGGWAAVIAHPINWGFFIGVIVGLISLRKFEPPSRSILLIHIIGCLAFIWYLMRYETTIEHGPIWSIPFGLLIFLLDQWNNVREIKVPRAIVFLGNISFSMYLTQEFAMRWADDYAPNFFDTELGVYLIAVLYVWVIIIMGSISHKLLEEGLAEAAKNKMLSILGLETRPQAA